MPQGRVLSHNDGTHYWLIMLYGVETKWINKDESSWMRRIKANYCSFSNLRELLLFLLLALVSIGSSAVSASVTLTLSAPVACSLNCLSSELDGCLVT